MKIKKIVLLVIFFIIINLNIMNSYAANIENSNASVEINKEFEYKINLEEKLVSVDFEIKYNADIIEFIGVSTDNVEYNKIEDGRIVFIYLDETGKGTEEIVVKFKAKKETAENDIALIKITDINGYSLEKQKGYIGAELNVEDLEEKVAISKVETNEEIKQRTVQKDNQSPKILPNTGIKSIIFIAIIIIGGLSVVFIIKYKKIKNIIPILVITFLFTGTLKSNASTGIFIKKYEKSNNLEDFIIVIPNKTNRNILKKDFQKELESNNIEVKEIKDNQEQAIGANTLIGTGSKITLKNQKEYITIFYGDINGDGKINSNDIGLILNEQKNGKKIEGVYRKAANVANKNDNNNQILNNEDIYRIKDYIIQKIDKNLVDEIPQEINESDKNTKEDKQEDKQEDNVKIEKLELNISKRTISKGEQLKVQTTITPNNATNKKINWQSSDDKIVIVDQNGTITGVGGGKAKITAKTTDESNISESVDISVNVPVEKITLNTNNINLVVGNEIKLVATITPDDATNKEINWTSSNSNIATVTEGKVKGISVGECIITATSKDGISAECKVTIQNTQPEEVEVTDVILSSSSVKLEVDKTETITATVVPSNATNKSLTWSSSNPKVATVKNGTINAISPGSCTIIVKSNNNIERECNVTVVTSTPKDVEVTDISLNKTSEVFDLSSNTKTDTLIATITPSNATNKTVFWTSSNTDVATVNSNGLITAKSNGTATITVCTENEKKATCELEVHTTPTGIYFEENKENSNQYLVVNKYSSIDLNPTIQPKSADIQNKVTYSVLEGNENIVQIDNQNGKIEGKQAGIVTLQAKTQNNKIATIKLNVKIGNKAYDFGKCSEGNRSLYTANITPVSYCDTAHMQSFDIDKENNSVYYATVDTKKDTSGNRVNPEISYISYGTKGQTPSDSSVMKFEYFGHQSAIDIEKSDKTYIWMESVATNKGQVGYGSNVAMSRVIYNGGKNYKYTIGPYKTSTTGEPEEDPEQPSKNGECNFVWIGSEGELLKSGSISIDEENNLLAVYRNDYIFIYDLQEALSLEDRVIYTTIPDKDGTTTIHIKFRAKVLYNSCTEMDKLSKTVKDITNEERSNGKIKQIKTVSKIREIYRNCRDKGDNMTSNDILKYPFQGFDLDGDYIYIAESQSNTNTHISKIMNTFDLDHPNYHNEDHTNSNGLIKGKSARISLTISQSMRGNMGTDDSKEPEIEGIKIDSSATSPIMYIGFVQSSQRANVIKFTY